MEQAQEERQEQHQEQARRKAQERERQQDNENRRRAYARLAQEQANERNKRAYHQYADTRLQAKQEALKKVAEGPVLFGGKGPLMPDPPRNYQEWMDTPPLYRPGENGGLPIALTYEETLAWHEAQKNRKQNTQTKQTDTSHFARKGAGQHSTGRRTQSPQGFIPANNPKEKPVWSKEERQAYK
ncbi:MAG: hypothetical protein AAF442_10180 [Pseudomonadota bacterium]